MVKGRLQKDMDELIVDEQTGLVYIVTGIKDK